MMMITNLPRKGQSGFTLMELMIALVVTTLVIGGYVGANMKAQQTAEAMHERTLAIQDGNRAIEEMRDASRTGTFPDNVVMAYPNNGTPSGFNNLTDEVVTVSYASTTANPLDVTVTVAWTSYVGREETEAVRTYITQR
jgi:prepilin-type N-terminal cleavage/methylation domain-containing protein